MAKRIKTILKLQLPAGSATPAPPVGPALGQHGINIMGFVKEYNARTASQAGTIIPAEITVYEDASFTFVTKTPPASDMLRRAAGITKGSAKNLQSIAGSVTKAQIREIAEVKLPDLNTNNIDDAVRSIEGSARSMGIEIK